MQAVTALLARASIEGLNVQIYGKILLNNGYDNESHFARLTEERLKEIGIVKVGHIDAILQAARAGSVPAGEPAAAPASAAAATSILKKPPPLDPFDSAPVAGKNSPSSSSVGSAPAASELRSPQGSPSTPNGSKARLGALLARISVGRTPSSLMRTSSQHTEDDPVDDVLFSDAGSVFHVRALESTGNPWSDRVFSVTKALQFSSALDSAFVTYASLQKARLWRAQKGDVIVSGVQRCGLTPALLALDALRRGTMHAARAEIVNRVEWIEAACPQPAQEGETRRLLRSHLTLRSLLSENAIPGKYHARAKEFKIVCVLRDPVAVRRSWYELAHQIFVHFNPDETWDFTVDDWCKIPVANYRMSGVDAVEYDYEHYLLEVIELLRGKHPNVFVLFYEDLLVHPMDFVARLQEITGLGDAKLAKLVGEKLASDDPNHPMSAARQRGESHGHSSMTKTSTRSERGGAGFMLSKRGDEYAQLSLAAIDGKWDIIVRARHKELVGYEALYEQLTDRKWPFGAHRKHVGG